MKFVEDKFEMFETNGDWALFLNHPVYKQIEAFGDAYIRNIKTGENCGQYVELRCRLFDEFGNKLDNPIYDEDCYEVILEDKNVY